MTTEQPAVEKARLLLCPFCGSTPTREQDGWAFVEHAHGCIIRVLLGHYSHRLQPNQIADWNSRAQSAAFDALVEAAADCAERMERAQTTLNAARGGKWNLLDTKELRAALAQVEELRTKETP